MRYTTGQLSTRGIGVVSCLVVLSLMAGPAGATTISECHKAIEVVRGELAGVDIGGNHPDRTRASLESKLDGADLKLDQGKFADALQKLTQFRDQVASLQSQGKITDCSSTVANLLMAADEAIMCVNNLMAGT